MCFAAQDIVDYLGSCRQEMALFLGQLARAESPTLVPESQKVVFALLAAQLHDIGYRIRHIKLSNSGGILLARPPRRRFQPVQLLLGHSDTVWPIGTLEVMPVEGSGRIIRGPGVFDMKGGLTQTIFALKAIQALGLVPEVTPLVLVNSDEETGSIDSHRYIQMLARVANRAFVMEPALGARGKLKTRRKGFMRFDVTILGKASHAGLAPEEGASAILELSHIIQKLFALNDPTRGVTVNVGVVNGGSGANVVAAKCVAEVDVRFFTSIEALEVAHRILSLETVTPGTRVMVEKVGEAPPLERTRRNRKLWQTARELAKAIDLDLEEGASGGGSDGNTTSQFTATLDGLGVVGDGAHARHEFADGDAMVERAALLALLVLAPPL
ncbi:MAG: M20/M25/M40 family metallo-hydrolase [Chloroflexota bacterium]|nr:M20/M25/M40 family metallo-hydrolase [Chloroflexota bacterium]